MGPYCNFCDRRCFVYLPWEELTEEMRTLYRNHSHPIDIIATCPGGQALEKQRIGVCYDDIKRLRETRQQEKRMNIQETTKAITLKQALLNNIGDDVLLDDGTDDWDPDNLIDTLMQSDEGEVELKHKVAVTERGIFFVKEDGYLQSQPAYTFKEGTRDDPTTKRS